MQKSPQYFQRPPKSAQKRLHESSTAASPGEAERDRPPSKRRSRSASDSGTEEDCCERCRSLLSPHSSLEQSILAIFGARGTGPNSRRKSASDVLTTSEDAKQEAMSTVDTTTPDGMSFAAAPGPPGPAGGIGPGGDEEFITSLNINDVLCGRGSGPNDHSGNVRFRQLVLSRKAEYLSTNARQTKARIAQEIVDHVRVNLVPPGRFLKKVDAEAAQAAGFPRGAEVWTAVTEDVALEKAKQALRQNRDKHLVAAELAEAQAQAALAAAQKVGTAAVKAAAQAASAAAKKGASDHSRRQSEDSQSRHSQGGPIHSAPPAYGHASPTYGGHTDPYYQGGGGDPYRDPYYGGGGGGGGGGGHYTTPPPLPQPGDPYGMPPPHDRVLPGPPHSSAPPAMGPGDQPPHNRDSRVMGPPQPGMPRQRSSDAYRTSLTVADLERDFQRGASVRHPRPHHPTPVRPQGGYGQGPSPPPRSQQQQHYPPQERPSQQQRQPLSSPPAPGPAPPGGLPEAAGAQLSPQEQAFREQFPYALGGRGPSAESMPDVDPLPASRSQGGAGASELRLSGRTIGFIEKAFLESQGNNMGGSGMGGSLASSVVGDGGGGGADGEDEASGGSSTPTRKARQKQYQMQGIREGDESIVITKNDPVSSPGGIVSKTKLADGTPGGAAGRDADEVDVGSPPDSGNAPGEEFDARRFSTMSDMSSMSMSMSMSLSDMNMSKELTKWAKTGAGQAGPAMGGGGAGAGGARPEIIQEGQGNEEDGSATEIGRSRRSVKGGDGGDDGDLGRAEPRRISSIQKKPDSLDEFGNSSMSIMKGLGGMESSSTFSAMSVLMSESGEDESSGHVGRQGSAASAAMMRRSGSLNG